MLLNITTGHGGMRRTLVADIIILASSLRRVAEIGSNFVFSDRHAYLQTAGWLNSSGVI